MLAGGKRLRPAFCFWAFVGAGGDGDDPAVIDAGAALELLHTFALVHDDIMDNSDRRRGLPTVHRHFEECHAEADWRGETRRFGEGAAILIGDLAFVYADQLLRGAPHDALDVFTELRLEVNVGQYLDLVGTVRGDASVRVGPQDLRRTNRASTPSNARCTSAPRSPGGSTSCRPAARVWRSARRGIPDCATTCSARSATPTVTGKPVGEDLRDGKPTTMFALAREAATGDDADAAARALRRAPICRPTRSVAIQAVSNEPAPAPRPKQRVDALVDQALAALADAPISADARDELDALARFVAERDF